MDILVSVWLLNIHEMLDKSISLANQTWAINLYAVIKFGNSFYSFVKTKATRARQIFVKSQYGFEKA